MTTFKWTVPDHNEWSTEHTLVTLLVPSSILTMIALLVYLEAIGKWMKANGDTASEVATIVIAISSLFVAIWSVVWTRKHNRLSVKPHISIVRVVDNNDGTKKGLYIRNHGLGPAIIESIRIEIPSKELDLFSRNDLLKLYEKYDLSKGDLAAYWLELLPKDACERVIWLESEDGNKNKEFEKLMFDTVFSVKYRSFYGERQTVTHKENAEQVGAGNGASRRA